MFRKKSKTTYKIETICSNCSNEEDVEIPKGVKVEAFCKNYICPQCGCKTMGKENDC